VALDLTPLEQAAARVGLTGRKARLVPADPRSGRLFRWDGTQLFVSERLVERLGPAEGQALLVNTVLARAAVRRALLRLAVVAAVGAGLLVLLGPGLHPVWLSLAWVGWCAALAAALPIAWSRAMLAADDATVRHLDQAEVLVRALNVMNQDRLAIAGRSWEARPDLHRRAERLASLHQLRLPPERRSVPVLGGACATGCGQPAGSTGDRACSDTVGGG